MGNGKRKAGPNGNTARAKENHHSRRALVRLMWLRGMLPHDIAQYLQQPVTAEGKPKTAFLLGHADASGTVRKDLMVIREVEKAVLREEQPHALATYVGQQKEIFRLALADQHWTAALKASMNIARSQGVDVDEVIRVIGDVEHSHSIDWMGELSEAERTSLACEVRASLMHAEDQN